MKRIDFNKDWEFQWGGAIKYTNDAGIESESSGEITTYRGRALVIVR